MSQYAFYFNADKCIGCRTCIIACKDKKNLKPGQKFRRVFNCVGGSWSESAPKNVYGYSLSMSCNHCQKPACVETCPVGAANKREDGIVYIDQEKCIGCMSCLSACPYKVPAYNPETKKMNKCDFCRELMSTEDEKPVCITSCQMRALDCGELNELLNRYPGSINCINPMPVTNTEPTTLITPHRKYDGNTTVINQDEETYASYGYK